MQTQKMALHQRSAFVCFTVCLLSVLSKAPTYMAETKYFDFEVALVNYTRNCHTKPIIAVNGQFPGPTIYVSEGDRVIVKVKNSGNVNVTIHWHGIRQQRSNWADGVGYVTECPILPGNYEIYDFVVSDQHGTTFWHAHVSWLRATVYGAFITYPKHGSYPFSTPDEEIPVILGEWWNDDVELVEKQALAAGIAFPLADAVTMNGFPGTQYNCSESEGLTTIDVEPGKTYLLRLINAALNTEMFFAIANHSLTVVEVDSGYSKPLTVYKGIVIAPGQSMNVLVTANQPRGTYYMVGQPHNTFLVTDPSKIPPPILPLLLQITFPIPTNGLFQYKDAPVLPRFYPDLPIANDTVYSTRFEKSLRALYSGKVPKKAHIRHLFYIVGTGTDPCTTCIPEAGGYRITQMINNITFVEPTISILQAYFYKIPGVYSANFPDFPIQHYNYTSPGSPPSSGQVSTRGTRVTEVEYGTVIQLVLQNINNFAFESHPFHLHGHVFYVLGQGFGNYDSDSDPKKFNYYDPIARNTVNVPRRGWVAIRFLADNPGVWILHCHLERHLSWGMINIFVVKNGDKPDQMLPPPKRSINKC